MTTEKLDGLSKRAREILKNGQLLQVTENLAYKRANNYDFARRIAQEIGLIFSGQSIKFLTIGQRDRAYSHCGLLAPPGMGKDFAYDLIVGSGIFPKDQFKVEKLDDVTRAAFQGSLNEETLVPPPTLTNNILCVSEFASLSSGPNAASLRADLRIMRETGHYTRRLVKIAKIDQTLKTGPPDMAEYIKERLEKYAKMGMHVDTEQCKLEIESSTSWIIASADFGTQTEFGKSLLALGDLNRIRWRSYLPNREERTKVISDVGSLPPITVNDMEEKACSEAWKTTITALKAAYPEGIAVRRDYQSHYERKRIWDETVGEMMDTYPELEKKVNFDQLMSLRNVSEFRRIMYQHAALKQFARASGDDLSFPEEFQIDYKEDGEFAKKLYLGEYVPSMLDIIANVLSVSTKPTKRLTKTSIGMDLVLRRLEKGPAKREELVAIAEKNGISSFLIDNQILPKLIEKGAIVRDSQGWYSLNKDNKKGE